MKLSICFGILLLASTQAPGALLVPDSDTRAPLSQLRLRAAGRDRDAILALGYKNDREAVPLLKKLATSDKPYTARAALTRMRAADHMNDFVVGLSTTNRVWKINCILFLGYIHDKRAIKHLVPLLDDNSGFENDSGDNITMPVSAHAALAMSDSLEDEVKKIRKADPSRGMSSPTAWKQWWETNKVNYSGLER